MQLHLNNGKIYSLTPEISNEVKRILTDKNIPDTEEIKGTKNVIKKSDIKYIIEGNYAYTKDGLHSIEKEKPFLFKVYHSNIATDFFIIEEEELESAVGAMIARRPFAYKGRFIVPIKILPHPNNHFGWNDDYIPTGEFYTQARHIESKLEGKLEKVIGKLSEPQNKRLN